MKKWILILLFFTTASQLFSLQPFKIRFYIHNSSSRTLIITKEYRDDPTKVYIPHDPNSHPYEPRYWTQDVCGINMRFYDSNIIRNEINVLPNL